MFWRLLSCPAGSCRVYSNSVFGSSREAGRKVISMKRSSVSTGGAGRLSMQELRSQDLNKPGLHTPQTKEKSTFGKLNINRPTSERKTSVFGKRTSGPGSRNSQFGIFSTSEKSRTQDHLMTKHLFSNVFDSSVSFFQKTVMHIVYP